MNRKVMRKSTLISSIAMLLVAVLALSGVTFAWFSSNPTAKATGLTMTSTAVTGVYLSEPADKNATSGNAGTWKQNLDWTDDSAQLKPVSCAFVNGKQSKFFTTTSANEDGTWVDEAINFAIEGTDYIYKRIWVRADVPTGEDAKKNDLKLTVQIAGSTQNYMRLVIIDEKTSKVYVYAPTDRATIDEENSANTTAAAAFTSQEGNTSYLKAYENALSSELNVLFPEFDGKERALSIFFYFEGQDKTCKPANSAATIGVTLQFDLVEQN